MKNKGKTLVVWAIVAAAFLFKLRKGLAPLGPGGAMNAPAAVVFSAVLTGAGVWLLMQAVFWALARRKKK